MKVVYTNPRIPFSAVSPLPSGTAPSVTVQAEQYSEGIVVDIITNDTHPDYSKDGYNVGVIKFRFLKTEWLRSDSDLHFAMPMSSNVQDYPLINEMVMIFTSLNRFYYTTKINVTNRVTTQAFFGVASEMNSDNSNRNASYERSTASPATPNNTQTRDRLGNYVKDNANIFRLRSNEGDIIYEGRFGHSIRFGMNREENQSPNLLLRVGQSPTPKKSVQSVFALIDEDINLDRTSLWLVANQSIPISLSTKDSSVHFKSISDPPKQFIGPQIVINTDSMIVNTKQGKMLFHSFNGIHLTSLRDVTTDSDGNIIMFSSKDRKITVGQNYFIDVTDNLTQTVAKNVSLTTKGSYDSLSNDPMTLRSKDHISLIAPSIYVGGDKRGEHMVLGDSLIRWLQDLTQALASEIHQTPSGPSSPPTNASKYTSLGNRAQQLLSQDNFVNKVNTRS